MDSSQPTPAEARWRDALREELSRRKIPVVWQRRLMDELDDHLSDLKEEHMADAHGAAANLESVVERLGEPGQVAASAAAEYRKLGLLARRPVITFFLVPIIATPLWLTAFIALTMLAMLPIGWALDSGESAQNSEAAITATNALAVAAVNLWRFVPFALAAWWFARLANRYGRGWRCILASCGIVAIYAALFGVSVQAKTATEPGSLMMGFHLPPQTFLPYLQAAIPLAVATWFLWRSRPSRNDPSRPTAEDLPCRDCAPA
jgi:hypothetical protein